uniref:SFRICE_025570 n=1 Tax=Spodoptera frugiperda TaxID=7108 RepID=A0A2H1V958_SPOFR
MMTHNQISQKTTYPIEKHPDVHSKYIPAPPPHPQYASTDPHHTHRTQQILKLIQLRPLIRIVRTAHRQIISDEVLAINDKVVLRAEDLLTWMCVGTEWRWGLRAVWRGACAPPADMPRHAPLAHSKLDFSDVDSEKSTIAVFMTKKHMDLLMVSNRRRTWTLETPKALQVRCRPFGGRNLRVLLESGIRKVRIGPHSHNETRKRCFTSVFGETVVSLRSSRPIRAEAWLSHNVTGIQATWLRDSLVAALGGYAAPTKNTRILYCKDTFEYPELEGHEFVCNHLAPRLKGRPRGRRRRATTPDDRDHDPASDRGRQMCTLRHVMPLYNVHTLFTICVISPM